MTAIVVHLHIVSGYFYATTVELNNCGRDPIMCQVFTILTKKIANPGLTYLRNKF